MRVVVSERAPHHFVRYADQLIGDNSAGRAPGGIEFVYSGNLLRPRDVDVIHLTDSAVVIGQASTPERDRVRRARRFTRALTRRRIALVRSGFGNEGLSSKAPSKAEALLDRATRLYLTVGSATPSPGTVKTAAIGHSHLRDRFLGYPRAATVSGRLLLVSAGELHPGYEAILKVVAAANIPDYSLRAVGTVPKALRNSFSRTRARWPGRISYRNEVTSDAARVLEVTRAEIVIVASADTLESLGTIMFALSLDRPVVVESTTATRLLADEVGRDWVILHEGRLTAAKLESALRSYRTNPPMGRPNLDRRDPNLIAAKYAEAYRTAAETR